LSDAYQFFDYCLAIKDVIYIAARNFKARQIESYYLLFKLFVDKLFALCFFRYPVVFSKTGQAKHKTLYVKKKQI